MPELWRHMLDLSVELDKFEEAGNCRDRRDAALRRGVPQRQLLPGPRSRSVIEHQSHLARILEAIPVPHEDYLPSRSRWPARQNEYIGHGYARKVTQIDALPLARERRPRLIHARKTNERKTNELRNYAVASLFGAIIGISSHALLFQGGAGKGEAVQALTSTGETAKTAGEGRSASDSAFVEPAPTPLQHEDAPPPQSVSVTMAQRGSSQGAFGRAEASDPNFRAPHEVQELKPDPSVARQRDKKEQAAKLGSPEAPQRRKKLSKTRASGSGVLRQ